MGLEENKVTNEILRALAGMVKLARVQCGTWITIQGNRMHGAPEGWSDYVGWRPTVITPEMVGKTVAIFTALEMKTATGKKGEAQIKFIAAVIKDGGIAGVCRTPDEALALLATPSIHRKNAD